jgi:hypothetical protein
VKWVLCLISQLEYNTIFHGSQQKIGIFTKIIKNTGKGGKMTAITIKINLLKVGKTQMDLLKEVRRRGYSKLSQPALNAYINGSIITPQAEAVLKICEQILKEWETNT